VLELAILGLLEDQELHGYEIRKRLRDELGLFSNISFGSLYPALSRLERAGAVQAIELGCRALHPHASLVRGSLVADAHHAGLSLAVWTVNDRAQVEALADLGVDTVITDDVSLALSALGRS